MELGYEFQEITTWIRATKSDFELVKNIGIRETGILVSCSDYHIQAPCSALMHHGPSLSKQRVILNW